MTRFLVIHVFLEFVEICVSKREFVLFMFVYDYAALYALNYCYCIQHMTGLKYIGTE